jgi:hypothetical protein
MNCVILYDIITYDSQKNVLHFFQFFLLLEMLLNQNIQQHIFMQKKKPCVVGFFERDGLERTRQKGKK